MGENTKTDEILFVQIDIGHPLQFASQYHMPTDEVEVDLNILNVAYPGAMAK